jgi:hypothetical protein
MAWNSSLSKLLWPTCMKTTQNKSEKGPSSPSRFDVFSTKFPFARRDAGPSIQTSDTESLPRKSATTGANGMIGECPDPKLGCGGMGKKPPTRGVCWGLGSQGNGSLGNRRLDHASENGFQCFNSGDLS